MNSALWPYAVEFATPLLILVAISLAASLGRRNCKAMLLMVGISHIAVTSFRDESYNSDTASYSVYLDTLSNLDAIEALVLLKLEPFHVLLAAFQPELRGWLVLEGIICAVLLIIVVVKSQRLETICAIFGSALPLYSSSVRFSVGIFALSALLLLWQGRWYRNVLVSVMAGLVHTSLLIAGLIAKRSVFWMAAVLLCFVLYTQIDAGVLERSGADEDNPGNASGLRPFSALVLLSLYLYHTVQTYTSRTFSRDLIVACLILSLSITSFPIINRWLIVLFVSIAIDSDKEYDGSFAVGLGEQVASLCITAALTFPFLIRLVPAIENVDW